MDLIYYRGLNCHLAGIINIVASLGINYQSAYATLWSEKDFSYAPQYRIYISKRIFENLEQLGIKIKELKCNGSKEAKESFETIPDKELFLVGMDMFYIPWSPVYQNFHGPHYFNVRKENTDILMSFDPIYNKKYMAINSADIINHAFDISQVNRKSERVLQQGLIQEAEAVLCKHPEVKENIWMEIQKCADEQADHITDLILLTTVMINNRYLFQHYLNQYLYGTADYQRFFTEEFFRRWEAVKNGLYKIKILKNKESAIAEVGDMYLNLIEEEMDMAKDIIQLETR